MENVHNIEEAFRISWDMKAKNSLSLTSYNLSLFINLIFNGWTIEEIGNAFKVSVEEVQKLLEERGYYNFQNDVEKLKNEIIILDEEIKDIAKNLKQKKEQEDKPEKMIIRDGVAFPEKYLSSKIKILWILKESYEKNGVYGWHVTGELKNNDQKTYKIIHEKKTLWNVCLISFAILHNCTYERAMDVFKANNCDLLDAIQKIGWINLNKIAAKETSNIDLTPQYITWEKVLKKQIDIYKPDIIICGNTLQYFSNDKNYFNFPKDEKILFQSIVPNKDKIYCYYPLKDRLYMNIHHPSYPMNWNECINEIITVVSDWKKKKIK